jgi:hypothetical protein
MRSVCPVSLRATRKISPHRRSARKRRARGVEIPQRVGAPEWLHTAAAAEHVARLLGSGRQVTDWLDRHVGPSELTPEEIWAR